MNGSKIAAGGSAGGALAALIVYVLSRVNVDLTAEDGAVGSAVLIAVAAFIAHNGIVGALRLIWRGSADKQSSVPPSV